MKTQIGVALIALACVLNNGCTAPNVNENVPHTTIKGSIAGQPFSIENPKDTILDGLAVEAAPGGAATIKIKHLSTVMNPTNTSATGDAGEKLIKANGESVVNGINAAAAAAKDIAGAAAKAATTP